MKFTATILGLAAIAASAPAPIPQNEDPNKPSGHEVEIQAVTYGGTGCPDQTVQGLLSNDKTTISLSFDAYTVQSGPNIPATDRRKFCQLQLKLKYPSGFQYSIFGADTRGYASLTKGVTGTAQSTYYFSGQTAQSVFPTVFEGPMDENYVKHDEVELGTTVWSPCGEQGILNIKSEVRITPFSSQEVNLLTVDTVDAKFEQKYFVQWQKCTPPKKTGGSGSTSTGRNPFEETTDLSREAELEGQI